MAEYKPTIEVDNATRTGMANEEFQMRASGTSLPEVTSSQAGGKTIRVNGGKSYVSTELGKKGKVKTGTMKTAGAGKRVMRH